ncbi:MAG: hypothetical protein ACERKT_03090 [Acidobacteriota bacterium]|jgi:hypothetical protein
MDIDELLADETVDPESGALANRPAGVDPESDSWLDAALLSRQSGQADVGQHEAAGRGRVQPD